MMAITSVGTSSDRSEAEAMTVSLILNFVFFCSFEIVFFSLIQTIVEEVVTALTADPVDLRDESGEMLDQVLPLANGVDVAAVAVMSPDTVGTVITTEAICLHLINVWEEAVIGKKYLGSLFWRQFFDETLFRDDRGYGGGRHGYGGHYGPRDDYDHGPPRGMGGRLGGGGPPPAPHDDTVQPPMMSFKAFLSTQDDSISDDDAIKKYAEYKLEFKRQQLNEFFVNHKEEEW